MGRSNNEQGFYSLGLAIVLLLVAIFFAVFFLLQGFATWSELETRIDERLEVLQSENKKIQEEYKPHVVKEIKRSNDVILVTLSNGETKEVKFTDNKLVEITSMSLQVELKEQAEKGSKVDTDSSVPIIDHFSRQDKIVATVTKRNEYTYVVELVDSYVVVVVQNGQVEELQTEKKEEVAY